MLFGYPQEATRENWLHESLTIMVNSIHVEVSNGKTKLDWPTIIPSAYREQLKKRRGLKERLSAYMVALIKVDEGDRNRVLKMLEDQNQIESLLSCNSHCETISELPDNIQNSTKQLFEFAFELLTDLQIRDRYYKEIYASLEEKVCPFCGCESFDGPGAPREALDHFLASSRYPFAAANLNNLIPMGSKCNSRYKLATDILRDETNNRRKSFYPFSTNRISFSLLNTEPYSNGNFQPIWELEFEPNCDEVKTWDVVFHSKERYIRDHLNPNLNRWLSQFGSWCQSANRSLDSDEDVLLSLERYIVLREKEGYQDRAFLKTAVFKMLYNKCVNSDGRLIKLIRNLKTRGSK